MGCTLTLPGEYYWKYRATARTHVTAPVFVSRWRSRLWRNKAYSSDYRHQLNMGDVRKRRVERPLLFASAFDNGMADRKSAFKSFNGNNQATSYPNFVNFRPVISEFTLLKLAIFAAIRPQFDDDLHSSRWRSKTD